MIRLEYGLRAVLPATLDALEEFLAEFGRCMEGCAPRSDLFAAELLLREAMTNAVMHGCRCDSSRRVRCVLRLRGRRLTIAVRDQGVGFDWRTFRPCEEQGLSPSGRGVEILRHYATRVRFSDKGNSVTMIRQLSEEVGR